MCLTAAAPRNVCRSGSSTANDSAKRATHEAARSRCTCAISRSSLSPARNSCQALANEPVRQVRVSTSVENDVVLVRFRDSGPGVARPEELFRPFQAGAHSFGLGLYISRAILRSHGGGLRYDPEEQGSCFTVELWPMEESLAK